MVFVDDNVTPLHLATTNARGPAALITLLEAGADPNSRDLNEWMPLHWAAEHSDSPAIVAALLEAGADPNARGGDDGMTPLHLAARCASDPMIVKLLLDADADPRAETDSGETVFGFGAGTPGSQ